MQLIIRRSSTAGRRYFLWQFHPDDLAYRVLSTLESPWWKMVGRYRGLAGGNYFRYGLSGEQAEFKLAAAEADGQKS